MYSNTKICVHTSILTISISDLRKYEVFEDNWVVQKSEETAHSSWLHFAGYLPLGT
jgi:hypothetical protein